MNGNDIEIVSGTQSDDLHSFANQFDWSGPQPFTTDS